ncbi:MAG: hypothetical protein P4L67_02640 [Candidatus Pacebacteria bacterium]|nr:hypothetical protein [Candidatus Paceibacterota bacterium]
MQKDRDEAINSADRTERERNQLKSQCIEIQSRNKEMQARFPL